MAKVLDAAVAAQFATSYVKAQIVNTATTSITTNSTPAGTAGANMSDKNVRDIVDFMKKNNYPRYDGQNYISIAATNSIRGLYDYFETKIQYTDARPMFRGEIGTYYGTRFIEETNYLSNVLNSSYGEAVFFGADAVREGIVIPEEIRIDLPKDFGRDQGIAWYYLGGFVKTWDWSVDGEERIVHVSST